MAGRITMSPDTMRTRAREYSREADNIQQVINKLDGLLIQLQQEWEGEASKRFADKFNELRPGFVNTKDLVNEISKSLQKAADETEELDRKIAGGYGN